MMFLWLEKPVLKLIIVDDESEIRVGLSNYFPWAELGYEVVGDFETPPAALDYIQHHPVDVVLTDIKMPKMNGLEFARHLHETHPQVRIVFLSGFKDFDFLKQAMSYGAVDYLLKPITHVEIRKTFGALRREIETRVHSSGTAATHEPAGLVQAVEEYVEQHYATTSLVDVAAHVHLNPNYLSKAYFEKTGRHFSDFLITVKMRKALELMNNRALKTYHISESVGYSNPNNFARAFKKFFGKTPSEYRNG